MLVESGFDMEVMTTMVLLNQLILLTRSVKENKLKRITERTAEKEK